MTEAVNLAHDAILTEVQIQTHLLPWEIKNGKKNKNRKG